MRSRTLAGTIALLLLTTLPAFAAAPAYHIKTADKNAPPNEVQEPIRKLLAERCIQLFDAKDNLLAELWFRKDVPVKASDAQIKNGLTYAEVAESTVVGALRLPKQISDYRKQKIRPGVYTLRMANQPMDGDHMGTAPYSEFLLLLPAAADKKADALEAKKLHEMSGKAGRGHPGILLLFPGAGATTTPRLDKKEDDHWVLLLLLDAKSGTKKARLPIGVTLIGVSSSA